MTSEESNGKMSSSETRSPLVANDDEIPIGEEENSLERNLAEENVSEEETAASALNPLPSDAAQILPMLQNLLLKNGIERERLTGLIQLYDPLSEDTNANVTTECEQIAREADRSSQFHFLEQSFPGLRTLVGDLQTICGFEYGWIILLLIHYKWNFEALRVDLLVRRDVHKITNACVVSNTSFYLRSMNYCAKCKRETLFVRADCLHIWCTMCVSALVMAAMDSDLPPRCSQ